MGPVCAAFGIDLECCGCKHKAHEPAGNSSNQNGAPAAADMSRDDDEDEDDSDEDDSEVSEEGEDLARI